MRYITVIFFLISIWGNAQNLVEYKFDQFFRLSLPKENKEIDTLSYKMLVSTISNGKLIIIKATNPQIKIHNKKELLSSYKAFHRGVIKKMNGNSINEETIKYDKILIDKLNFTATVNDVIQEIESYAFYLEDYYYSLQFWHPEIADPEYDTCKEEILASISFEPKLTIHNQYTKK